MPQAIDFEKEALYRRNPGLREAEAVIEAFENDEDTKLLNATMDEEGRVVKDLDEFTKRRFRHPKRDEFWKDLEDFAKACRVIRESK